MISQHGYLPGVMASTANGIQVRLSNNVVYAAPMHLMKITAEATDAVVTYDPTVVLGGMVVRSGITATRIDLLPTAALIIGATKGAVVGMCVKFIIRNTTAQTCTLGISATGLSAGTDNSTLNVVLNSSTEFLLQYTNVTPGSEAITVWTLATAIVH